MISKLSDDAVRSAYKSVPFAGIPITGALASMQRKGTDNKKEEIEKKLGFQTKTGKKKFIIVILPNDSNVTEIHISSQLSLSHVSSAKIMGTNESIVTGFSGHARKERFPFGVNADGREMLDGYDIFIPARQFETTMAELHGGEYSESFVQHVCNFFSSVNGPASGGARSMTMTTHQEIERPKKRQSTGERFVVVQCGNEQHVVKVWKNDVNNLVQYYNERKLGHNIYLYPNASSVTRMGVTVPPEYEFGKTYGSSKLGEDGKVLPGKQVHLSLIHI
eukprot:1251081-Rhodomonas_salina.1